MGHSRYGHGLQLTGRRRMEWRARSRDAQRRGSTGPKRVILGVSTALAICDGPVSFVMKRSSLLMSAARPPSEVCPATFSARGHSCLYLLHCRDLILTTGQDDLRIEAAGERVGNGGKVFGRPAPGGGASAGMNANPRAIGA